MSEALVATAFFCLTLVALTAIGSRTDISSKIAAKAIEALKLAFRR